MGEEYRYVRMMEYKPRLGQSAKSRTIRAADKDYRIKIDPETRQRPWHRVPLHIAKICEEMVVDPNREASPLCMEVCTEEEALARDAAAKRARLAKKAKEAPTVADAIDHTESSDLSLADVRGGKSRSAAMAAATAPAGLPDAAAEEAPQPNMQAQFDDFVAEYKAKVEGMVKSAGEATAASEAVIEKQGEKIAKLEKQLAASKKKAKKAKAEKAPKKAADEPPKRKPGRPPKDKG